MHALLAGSDRRKGGASYLGTEVWSSKHDLDCMCYLSQMDFLEVVHMVNLGKDFYPRNRIAKAVREVHSLKEDTSNDEEEEAALWK